MPLGEFTDVAELIQAIDGIDRDRISKNDRKKLSQAAGRLQAKTECPWDTIQRLAWTEVALVPCIKTLVDLKLFEKWSSVGGGPKTGQELGDLVDAEPELLVRLLRVIAACGFASMPGPDTFQMDEFSQSLADITQQAAFHYVCDFAVPTLNELPKFLAANGYRSPTAGPNKTAFNRALNTADPLFDYWKARPEQEANFSHVMRGYSGNMAPWTEIFPTEELLQGLGDRVAVVDVGGGTGHDLRHFADKHDLPPAQLVLQDLPGLIAATDTKGQFNAMAHDFFTEQPVRGARAYYLHAVIHDWPDAESTQILSRLRDAMNDDSRILVHDMFIPATDCPPLAAQSDVLMMAALNAKERTADMWEKLAGLATLRIAKIHSSPLSPQSVVEFRKL